MDYQQSTGSAQSWRRAYQIHVNNFLGQPPGIVFQEEDVVAMGGKTFSQPSMSSLTQPFVVGTEIPLLNPLTGESLGSTAKHEDLQVILYSLYVQLATARDAQVATAAQAATDLASRQAAENLQRAQEALQAAQEAAAAAQAAVTPQEGA